MRKTLEDMMLSEKTTHRKTIPHEPTQENLRIAVEVERRMMTVTETDGSRREWGVGAQGTQGFT